MVHYDLNQSTEMACWSVTEQVSGMLRHLVLFHYCQDRLKNDFLCDYFSVLDHISKIKVSFYTDTVLYNRKGALHTGAGKSFFFLTILFPTRSLILVSDQQFSAWLLLSQEWSLARECNGKNKVYYSEFSVYFRSTLYRNNLSQFQHLWKR